MPKGQLLDGRSAETIALTPALPADPAQPAPEPRLADLLHPEAHHWISQFQRFLHSSLAPWRSDISISIPTVEMLRPMIWHTTRGHVHDGWDNSASWRLYFGTHCDAAQMRLRSLFQSVCELKHPAIDDVLVNTLARLIIDVFTAAAAQQSERLARLEAERGPVARARAAVALLEQLPPFVAALEAYDRATSDAAGRTWIGLVDEIRKVERAARLELS